jgi:tetratricopeptide (TPR) repeat protein
MLALRFANEPSIGLAAEIISAGLVEHSAEHLQSAAAFVLASGKGSAQLSATAENLLRGQFAANEDQPEFPSLHSDKNRFRSAVAIARARTRSSHVSPLAWLDLAFLENLQGDFKAAERNVAVALRYGPESRLIRRAAAQFFVHKGDPGKAVHVLEKASQVKTDPWLLAAHIAVESEFREPRLLSYAIKRLRTEKYRPLDVSELFAAIATQEFVSGAKKRLVKSAKASLVQPTENALAQLTWIEAVTKFNLVDPALVDSAADAHEARARKLFANHEWALCCDATWCWLADQPFSERAASLGSFVCLTFMDDPSQAINFTLSGLRANPSSFMLLNNKAVAHLTLGEIDNAEATLQKSPGPRTSGDEIVANATLGMLLFRRGNYSGGRQYYEKSIQLAEKRQDYHAMALNRLFLGREELRIGEHENVLRVFDQIGNTLTKIDSETATALSLCVEQIRAIHPGVDRPGKMIF